MKALIAFIGMAAVIIALIEFNERRKAKQPKVESQKTKDEDCSDTTCTDCSLLDICDKDKKTTI